MNRAARLASGGLSTAYPHQLGIKSHEPNVAKHCAMLPTQMTHVLRPTHRAERRDAGSDDRKHLAFMAETLNAPVRGHPGWTAPGGFDALIDILPIGQIAPQAVETLLDEAFGKDRHGRTAYRLRQGMTAIDTLSFAAIEDGVLVGSIQCWPVQLTTVDGAVSPLILVGPVAVRPDRQRDGIGRRLTDAMLEVADNSGSAPLVLIGDPEYYDRFFGFSAEHSGEWELPGPVERRRLLTRLRAGQQLPRVATLGPRIASPLVQDGD